MQIAEDIGRILKKLEVVRSSLVLDTTNQEVAGELRKLDDAAVELVRMHNLEISRRAATGWGANAFLHDDKL